MKVRRELKARGVSRGASATPGVSPPRRLGVRVSASAPAAAAPVSLPIVSDEHLARVGIAGPRVIEFLVGSPAQEMVVLMTMSHRCSLLGLWLVVQGCTCAVEPIGKQVVYEPPPSVPLSSASLPVLANGNVLVTAAPGLSVEADERKRTPATAVGRCATWVMSCFEPASRSLDDCMRSVPSCSTQTPWDEAAPCCPGACKDEYAATRRRGVAPYEAFDAVLYVERTCVPGLVAHLEGR